MRRTPSFRRRLSAGFLAASLIPLLACSAMMLQIFRLRMTAEAEREMEEYLSAASGALDTAFDAFAQAAGRLQSSAIVSTALAGDGAEDTLVNGELFDAAGEARSCAVFDLYDLQGRRRYSTRRMAGEERLSTTWGVLYAAAGRGEPMAFTARGDVTDTDAPLLQGAARLTGPDGRETG